MSGRSKEETAGSIPCLEIRMSDIRILITAPEVLETFVNKHPGT